MKNYYSKESINHSFDIAKEEYQAFGIDVEKVMDQLDQIGISLHCWQGDDVGGFEEGQGGASGGTLTTGNYPGKARNGDELRQDLEVALSLIPGRHRVNLHAIYAETGDTAVERDELTVEHFRKWIDWAKQKGLGLDFNPTFFSHRMAASGYTLSSQDENVRNFWIRHGNKCREIAAAMGKELGTPCINNIWIPDGSKDIPADRLTYRKNLKDSLDEMLSTPYDPNHLIDTVECKLFGIGVESYTVGSHEFYMGYGLTRDVMLCFDMGHFHPTESVADKISSMLQFKDGLLLHVSRGVRWDSDHVVILNDDIQNLAQEVVRCDALGKVHFALDFFDASINRITAWVTGTRALQKALLAALLEPVELIREAEKKGDLGSRLAWLEEFKTLPMGAVWNKFCMDRGVPVSSQWIDAVKTYENNVLSGRI